MEEYQFKKAALEDKEIIDHYFRHHTSRSCERTFVNLYLWSRQYPVKWAVIENTLVFKSEDENHIAFAFPAGKDEDVKNVIPVLERYCEDRGRTFSRNGSRTDTRSSMTVTRRIMFMRLRSWQPYPVKNYMASETILINLKLCMKTAGATNR